MADVADERMGPMIGQAGHFKFMLLNPFSMRSTGTPTKCFGYTLYLTDGWRDANISAVISPLPTSHVGLGC